MLINKGDLIRFRHPDNPSYQVNTCSRAYDIILTHHSRTFNDHKQLQHNNLSQWKKEIGKGLAGGKRERERDRDMRLHQGKHVVSPN